jgi:molybdenum cofactor cytidylyltransferase
MGNICAIILAAGESKRMKVPKLLLPIGEKSMIENVIDNVTGSQVFHTLVVLGSYRDEIHDIIVNLPVSSCYNENFKDGMLSSVQCGFRNLKMEYDAVLVFPGDQPFIKPEVINRIIETYRLTGKGIIIPLYRKKRGHPVLIDARYSEAVFALPDKEGLRSLSRRFADDVFELQTGSSGILKDFNTKEDYLNEINRT